MVGNDFSIERFDAITPANVIDKIEQEGLRWNWPHEGTVFDEQTNMQKHAYSNPMGRYACSMSHFYLWKKCIEENEPILILEHDALFIENFDYQYVLDSKYEVIGINDPRKATSRDDKFHAVVQSAPGPLLDVPIVKDMKVPQGIAGSSAYVIKPRGADQIIKAAYQYGLWPNDALVCRQLFDFIGVTKKYYTKTQGLESTISSRSKTLRKKWFKRLIEGPTRSFSALTGAQQ